MAPAAGRDPSDPLPDPPAAAAQGGEASTILVIEDNATVRAVVRRHLEAGGYLVLEAGDGQSGLDLIEGHPGQVDLVLTDIDLPRIDGITVAEVLADLRPQVGVICMSGRMSESGFLERLPRRSQPFLPKPFTGETLTQLLAAELARSRARAARSQADATTIGNGAPHGQRPLDAAVGLVAAAHRLQQGQRRNGSTPMDSSLRPQLNGRPRASEVR
jgi:CheY-like chemotaxis protein